MVLPRLEFSKTGTNMILKEVERAQRKQRISGLDMWSTNTGRPCGRCHNLEGAEIPILERKEKY